ncbi:peptidylprolyl isomerase [Pseudorhodobacter antarcticus]|jgi:peptidylprolyl isomerase|uniref:Peptidyl-prolyl cis-trans isomerase n=1 Tax=Pseudorhodobacter antarcticus TaxID=1077947 RepID=A0A1H8DAA8_9RHOB|nr:peptidylprolyl isomerase [Pseudorhodobacter antarcticus]SEN04179.1 peptidylprolyl isomerase [Pseudorhodobacter antarcticus]
MRKENMIAGGVFALGLAVLGGWTLSHTASPAMAQAVDGPGPNLVIAVDGTAKGTVVIDMLSDLAPLHVAQITALAVSGAYDGVVFHRVIDGFMAQTGDVEFGKSSGDTSQAGMGGSSMPDIKAEFSSQTFDRGIVGMARGGSPDSANSQFFIMFAPGPSLDSQYTVVGRVIEGMDVVDQIKRGAGSNGEVNGPDQMVSVTVQN